MRIVADMVPDSSYASNDMQIEGGSALYRSVVCNLCGSAKYLPMHTIHEYSHPFDIVRCAACGLVYMNPMFTDDTLRSFYNEGYYSKASEYVYFDERKYADIVARAARNRLARIRAVVPLECGRLLDVGCAFGGFLATVREVCNSCTMHGVDVSEYASDHARKTLGLNVFTGTLRDAQYPDAYFDAVVMSEVIEHLSDPSAELREVARVMKPRSVLVVETCDIDSIEARIKGKRYAYFVPGHVHYFSRRTIRMLCAKNGLVVERILPVDCGLYAYSLFKVARKGLIDSRRQLIKHVIRSAIGSIHVGNVALAGTMVCYIRKG